MSIKDTGIGIDPAMLLHIIRDFRSIEKQSAEFGRAVWDWTTIVKKLVDLNQGTIAANDGEGGFASRSRASARSCLA